MKKQYSAQDPKVLPRGKSHNFHHYASEVLVGAGAHGVTGNSTISTTRRSRHHEYAVEKPKFLLV